MTAFYLQSALLLGVAYFLGCFLACMARTKLVSPPEARVASPDNAAVTATAVPIARTPSIPAQPIAPPPTIAPARQPAAQPMAAPVKDAFRRADTIEPVAKPATPQSSNPPSVTPVTPATRFEQALTAAPKTSPAIPALAKPVAPPPTAATAASAEARPVATAPASSAAASAAAAAAAAAAVVSAAAARRVQPVVPAITPAPQPPVRVHAPSAPIPAPPLAPTPPTPPVAATPSAPDLTKPDDLKRIRTVDALLETSLNRLGVRRYSDIARWRTEDVARISQALGFKGRIEQENWIEQAQILSRGEDTFYSRRLARGEQPSAKPVTDEGTRKTATPPASQPVSSEPIRSRSGVEAAAAAAAALAAAAAASRQATPAAARPAPAPPTPIQTAPTIIVPTPTAPTAPKVEERAAFARPATVEPPATVPITVAHPALQVSSPTPPPAAPTAAVAPPPPVAATAAPVADTAQRPVIGSGRDNLQRIGGINPEIEKALNLQGVTRYSQIAHWSKIEIDRFDHLLGHTGRVQRENWIEQAQILSKGGDTAYSREHDRRLAETTRREEAAARPTRLADAIRSNDTRPAPDQRARSNDLSSLRSVRSEAFRPTEQSGAAQAGGRSDQPAGSPVRPGARQAIPDDLKRIRGIGVLIEKKLNSMGITGYTQVANWSAADIERISHVLDFKGRIERENWVEQARILAAGGQTEFSRKADRDGIS